MIKEAKATGLTVEEAKDKALALLCAGENDDVQFDVISQPKKKFLGLFGGAPAEVRVYVEVPDEKPKKKFNNKPVKSAENKPKKVENKKAEVKTEVKAEAKKETVVEAKAEKVAEKPLSSVADDFKDTVDVETLPADSPAVKAVQYLRTILKQFGCNEISAKVALRENGAFIVLDGEDLSAAIGHRGETLDALQYLTGLAANDGGGYYKVSLNIGNYREKREQTLIALANRVSEQVVRTGRSRSLEPMNPYERRIIHTAVQGIEGVVSNSIGEGSSRRIVIYPEGGDMRPPRGRSNDRRRGGNRGRNGGRDRLRNSNVVNAPAREPKKDTDLPLYGKIN
ncbi:MAG: KH domain-containing protein [Ruminococcaceae bacterium]|nr:KH domain-containing protein [Oscillospiraceae bacterium]